MLDMNKRCKVCDFELHLIARDILFQAISAINVPPKSISAIKNVPETVSELMKESYRVCPRCDAYLLGEDRNEPWPIEGQDGQMTNVEILEGKLWHTD